MGRARRRGVRRVLRQAAPHRRDTGREPHRLRRPRRRAVTRISCSRPRTRRGRRTTATAATACTPARPTGRAYKVSYNRPFNTRASTPEDFVFNAEYPMIRWLEANGYDVSYVAAPTPTAPARVLQQHKVFMSVGHDEYWSGQPARERRSGTRRRRAPRVLQRQRVFWKTRWEPSIDGVAHRPPHPRLVQGDARGRQDRPVGRSGPAPGATRSVRARRRRRPARERA